MTYAELRERTNASLSGACRHGVAADMALAVLMLLDQIELLTAERDAAIARAEVAEALTASRPEITSEDAAVFANMEPERFGPCNDAVSRMRAALRAHAAKVSR